MRSSVKKLLGSMMQSNLAASQIAARIGPGVFDDNRQAQAIYSYLCKHADNRSGNVSFLDVANSCGIDKGIVYEIYSSGNAVGWEDVLSQVVIDHEEMVLTEASSFLGRSIGRMAPSKISAEVDKIFSRMSAVDEDPGFVEQSSVYLQALKVASDRRESKVEYVGIQTGLKHLDDTLDGLLPKHIHIAARPSMGKTAMMNYLQSSLKERGYRSLVNSLETDPLNLVFRDIARQAGTSIQAVRKGAVTDEIWNRVKNYCNEMAKSSRDTYLDRSSVTWEDLERWAYREYDKNKYDAMFLDYLQLLRIRDQKQRHQAISEISNGLSNMARSLGIPIVSLGQVGRSTAGNIKNRPTMMNLSEGGAIEQAAYAILLMHRPGYYGHTIRETDQYRYPPGYLELIVAKNKDGQRGTIEAIMDLQSQSFRTIGFYNIENPPRSTNKSQGETEFE